MYNWSVDTKRLKKNPEALKIFELEQSINFGLNGKVLNETDLRKHWEELIIDPNKKRFLELLLWPSKS